MTKRRPPRLPESATVGVVASSSPAFGEAEVRRGVARLEAEGHRVVFMPNARAARGYLAGSATERAEDLHAAFTDARVDAVLQLRGGYGAAGVLPLLDYEMIAAHPKPLIGMSDATMLHTAIGQRAGLVTFWGPGLTGLARATDYTWRELRAALGHTETPRRIPPDPDEPVPGASVHTLTGGVAEGELVGGTASLLSTTLGTPWELETAGKILLLEDVGEEPYRIDRLLTHLSQAGKLSAAAGIVVGEHAGVRPQGSFPGGSLSLDELLADVVGSLGVPAIHGLPLGHGRHLATAPLGVTARVDADAGELTLLEPGVA